MITLDPSADSIQRITSPVSHLIQDFLVFKIENTRDFIRNFDENMCFPVTFIKRVRIQSFLYTLAPL